MASPADSAVTLPELRVRTNLKMPDCLVLLAAKEAQACVATFDGRLCDAAASRNLVVVRD
jgi:predicted nucleic acid-binding protein